MASLGSTRIGNANPSSLLRAGTTLAGEVQAYQDSLASYEYEISAKTDGDLGTYQDYLQGRIDKLNSTGTVVNASKALSLTKTLTSAIHSNSSSNIQRENIQVMAGNATPQDKYGVIVSQFNKAISIGDMGLAQSLESQAYSLSQTIQLQQQQAADAAQTLAKAGAAANASSQQHIATNLTVALKQLNTDIQNAGQKDFNKTVKAWVATNSDTLKALGVALPNNAQPNYWDIVHGVAGAIYNAHMLAYQAELPYNPDTAQGYYNSAMELASGISNLPTLAGSKSVQQIAQAAQNPAQYAYNQASGKFVEAKQTGNSYVPGTGVVPTYSGAVNQTIFLSPTETTLMTKLGLNFNQNTTGKNAGTTGNGVQVQATESTPIWLKNVLGKNGVTNMFLTPSGLQFEADSVSGTGKAVYTVVKDANGLHGLAEESNQGTRILHGEYGFNPGKLSNSSSSGKASLPGQSGLLDKIFTNPNNLVSNAQITQAHVAAANAAAAAEMLKYTPPPLPNVTINNTPAPQTVSLAPATAPSTKSVVPQTVNPQPGAKSPQQPGSINLQGGGFRLQ